MQQVIIDHVAINYIMEVVSKYLNMDIFSFGFLNNGKFERIIKSSNVTFVDGMRNFFSGMTVSDVIIVINNSNLSDLRKGEIIKYLKNMISTENVTILINRVNELEKLVHSQNDKINILIDALDLANQNSANAKK